MQDPRGCKVGRFSPVPSPYSDSRDRNNRVFGLTEMNGSGLGLKESSVRHSCSSVEVDR